MFILFWEWSWMSKTSQAVVEPRGRTTGCSIRSVPTKAATAANTVAIVKSNSPGTHPRDFWLLVQATTITKLLSPPTITWPSSTSSFPATKGDHVVDQLRKGSLAHPAGLTCRSTPLAWTTAQIHVCSVRLGQGRRKRSLIYLLAIEPASSTGSSASVAPCPWTSNDQLCRSATLTAVCSVHAQLPRTIGYQGKKWRLASLAWSSTAASMLRTTDSQCKASGSELCKRAKEKCFASPFGRTSAKAAR